MLAVGLASFTVMFKFSTTVAEKTCAAASKQKEIESMVFFMFKNLSKYTAIVLKAHTATHNKMCIG
jgi:hypothetical protein